MYISFLLCLLNCFCFTFKLHAQTDLSEESLSTSHFQGERPETKAGSTRVNTFKRKDVEGEHSKAKDESPDILNVPNTPKSPHMVTGVVTFLSDYRSRGISQTMHQPAVQGEIKYTHESGFYFKSWGSNVDGSSNYLHNTSLEWDLSLGIEHQIGNTPFRYDAGWLYYYYPAGESIPKGVKYDTLEYYFAIIYKGFNIKLYQVVTDFFGDNSKNPPFNWRKKRFVRPNGHSYGSPYVEANLEWSPYPKLKTSLRVGYQTVTNYSMLNYLDWQVGLSCEFTWVTAALYYIATNANPDFYDVPDAAFHPHIRRLGAPTVVLAISRKF
jgi:uncharacterized protein (TIGR02001 family)